MAKPLSHPLDPRRYMNVEQIAWYLDSTPGSIRVKVWRREIPFLKCGRRVLFDREAIDSWLAAQRVEVVGQ